jgi:predicted SprT family Zn-dependent metalloprotease
MSKFSKLTQKISGVEQSRDATQEIKQLLIDSGDFEENPLIQERYYLCASCPKLKEEFKLFGITVKDQTPVCGECGCNLLLKIPMSDMSCPLDLWKEF